MKTNARIRKHNGRARHRQPRKRHERAVRQKAIRGTFKTSR